MLHHKGDGARSSPRGSGLASTRCARDFSAAHGPRGGGGAAPGERGLQGTGVLVPCTPPLAPPPSPLQNDCGIFPRGSCGQVRKHGALSGERGWWWEAGCRCSRLGLCRRYRALSSHPRPFPGVCSLGAAGHGWQKGAAGGSGTSRGEALGVPAGNGGGAAWHGGSGGGKAWAGWHLSPARN